MINNRVLCMAPKPGVFILRYLIAKEKIIYVPPLLGS
jgi:hypothetical protein